MKKYYIVLFIHFFPYLASAVNLHPGNTYDTIIKNINTGYVINKPTTDSSNIVNIREKPFSFLTNVPADMLQIVKSPFQKQYIKAVAALVCVNTILIITDESLYKGVRKFSDNIHFHPAEKNKILLDVESGKKEIVLLKTPQNLNTGFYNIGQGFTTMLIAAGLYTQGKISKNKLSLQTAADLTESFICLGLITQVLKYTTGREDPGRSEKAVSAWHPFPSLSSFQHDKPKYDAFPSGHLSTLMATVTILANNYPNNKLIKPIGYSLAAITSLCMVNNGVHWIGDYPLAIGLGYLTGNIITARHKQVHKIPAYEF